MNHHRLVRPALPTLSVPHSISHAARIVAAGLCLLALLAMPTGVLAGPAGAVGPAEPSAPAAAGKTGVLLLAHGGSASWNERVKTLAGKVAEKTPIEVAFGMASRPAIQGAVDKLVAGGVTEIIAVPLFVSDHSSVITSTQYLLGAREDMPEDLRTFAKMDHSSHGAPAASTPSTGNGNGTAASAAQPATPAAADAHAGHAGHGTAAPAQDNTARVNSPVPIRMTGALGRHRLVAEILAARASSISKDAASEAVILVAHGPGEDDENRRWVEDLLSLAAGIHGAVPFASVDALTVRDDAEKPVRDAATAELRALVEKRTSEKKRVLLVPVLMSYGGIEKGIQKRLDGLDYTMPDHGLMPDDRLVAWVLEMASTGAGAPSSASR
jgi:sirohydrochlorin ferrochelatase